MPVNRNCNLTLILINKEMKLFSLVNLIQRTMFHSQIKFDNNSIAKFPYKEALRNCVKIKIKLQFSYSSKNQKI